MHEVVESIKRVTDIMTEIAEASQEQSQGIEQVNHAILVMGNVTQKNAALVEEAAAATRSTQEQAANLVQVVSVFNLTGEQATARSEPAAARNSSSGTQWNPAPKRCQARKE
jgi:hypothetical protein